MQSARLGRACIRFSVGVGKGSLSGGGRMSIRTITAINAGSPMTATKKPATTNDRTARREAVGSCLQCGNQGKLLTRL